jgi:hypothetical protein
LPGEAGLKGGFFLNPGGGEETLVAAESTFQINWTVLVEASLGFIAKKKKLSRAKKKFLIFSKEM